MSYLIRNITQSLIRKSLPNHCFPANISTTSILQHGDHDHDHDHKEKDSKSKDTKRTSPKGPTPRMEEFQKKLREKTPIGKLDEIVGKHPYEEKEPLKAFPNNVNPSTGEVGGPRGDNNYLAFIKYYMNLFIGPEPTRYGDWERKGRVTDF